MTRIFEAELPERPGVRTGGWSQSYRLAVGGAAVGGGLPSARFQVSFYAEGDPRQRPASVYTLSFHVDTLAIANALFRKVNPVATVTFSSEGNSFTRRFSLVNGISISGVCEHVSGVIEDQTLNPGGGVVVVPSGEYTVTVVATPGTRPGGFIPPYLRSALLAAALAPAVFTEGVVPDDGGTETVMVFAFGTGGGVAMAEQRDASGAILAAWDPRSPVPVALHPQAQVVRVTNVGAAGTVRANMLFGVDG